MCGIVGLISKFQSGFHYGSLDMFEQMLIADSVRGKDSTGAFCVSKLNGVKAIKHKGHPYDTFQTAAWKKFKEEAFQIGRILVGHNRAATRGEVSNTNAHPFVKDHIILVHNGTLHDHKGLADTAVDSEAIATAIARDGYKAALKACKGAWALVWYDTKTKVLHLTNNGERPLAMLETSDVMMFGSEIGLLQWMAVRNRLNGLDKSEMKFIKKWELVKVHAGQNYSLSTEDLTTEIEEKKPFSPPVVHHSYRPPASGPIQPEAKRFSNNQTSEAEDVPLTELIKIYPANTKVLVVPHRVHEVFKDGKDSMFRMEGLAYRPGGKVVPCAANMMFKDLEEAADFCSAPLMQAEVLNHVSESTRFNKLILKEVQTVTMWETWVDKAFAFEEFEMLTESHKCQKCGGDLDVNSMDISSVNPGKKTGEYTVTCHMCVWKNRNEMPDNLRDRLNKVVFDTMPEVLAAANSERMDETMRGSSHGS